jgi:hypothetical protein
MTRLSNDEIEAEIARLTAEAHQKISSVRAILRDATELMVQAEMLKQVISLRDDDSMDEMLSFLILGFVRKDDDSPVGFLAITWAGSIDAPREIRVSIDPDWRSKLPPQAGVYVNDLLNDWRDVFQTNPQGILKKTSDLSVGPIRTMDKGSSANVDALIRGKIGETKPVPLFPRIK